MHSTLAEGFTPANAPQHIAEWFRWCFTPELHVIKNLTNTKKLSELQVHTIKSGSTVINVLDFAQ